MKPKFLLLLITAATMGNAAEVDKTPLKTLKLDTEESKVSYILGTDIGNHLKRQGLTVDKRLLFAGIEDMIAGRTSRIPKDEEQALMTAFMAKQAAKREGEFKALADTNKQAGEKFLAENAQKKGVIILESGLQYKVLDRGKGKSPGIDDLVQVNYRGTLLDGTEFDSSAGSDKPADISVKNLIPGWKEALQLMKEGDKWELFIPPDLAYGSAGTNGPIGPNQALLFEVELLKVLPAGEADKLSDALPSEVEK